MPPALFIARAILVDAHTWIEDGALLVERGRVLRICVGPRALARAARSGARVVSLGDSVAVPGWVNAHAHLELGALAGRTPRGAAFARWVRAVLAAKASVTPAAFATAVADGASASLRAGVTSLADIASLADARRGLGRSPLRVWTLREVLDAHDPSRTAGELAKVRRALRVGDRRREGLSPHAPFTVSPALLGAAGHIARRRRAPVAVHWSETAAEVQWLRQGVGPLGPLLGPSPLRSGLDLLERAGLLRAPLALIHGNFPLRGEPERIARAGAVVVHCPGTHAWFEREPFGWRRYLRAGVRLALGTDSLASNESLDMGRELSLARRSAPWLAPEQVFDMATAAGAAALGMEGRLGVLRRGALADFALYDLPAASRRAVLEALTTAAAAPTGVWIGGRRAIGAP